MSDTKRTPSPPPAYPLTNNLHSTSHDYTLSVHSSGPFLPGTEILFSIDSPSSAKDGPITCILEGMTCCEIMGKTRYQMGQIMAGPGMGGGPGALITAHEDHVFASTSTQIEGDGSIRIPTSKTCRHDGGLLPYISMTESNDKSWVRWRLKAYIKRKGFLKRDVKLSVDIPVILSSAPPTHESLENTASRVLSVDGHAPSLNVSLVILPSDPASPLNIPFIISLETYPPPSLLSADDLDLETGRGKLRVSFSLSRHVWTKGLEDQAGLDDSQGFEWPGSRIGTLAFGPSFGGHAKGQILYKGITHNGMTFEGIYEVPETHKSAAGCGLSIRYSAHAHVEWDKIKGTLQADIPIILAPAVGGPSKR